MRRRTGGSLSLRTRFPRLTDNLTNTCPVKGAGMSTELIGSPGVLVPPLLTGLVPGFSATDCQNGKRATRIVVVSRSSTC